MITPDQQDHCGADEIPPYRHVPMGLPQGFDNGIAFRCRVGR